VKTTVEHYYAVRVGQYHPYFLLQRGTNVPALFEHRPNAAEYSRDVQEHKIVIVEVRETRKRSLKRTRAQKSKKRKPL
jgi:hypothetical protein